MKFKGHYTITIEMNDLVMPPDYSSDQLNNKIQDEGRKRLVAYLTGNLFDPEKKIIKEETKFELKQI
jgi:hypothetical protein